jgi:hypothetical protein
MTVSSHSNISSVHGQPTQSKVPPTKTESPAGDTVQLSSAATAQLKKSDADGDGDGH